MHRLGLNSPWLLCLWDARHTSFQNSLFGLVESNLEIGPVYFDCYPNFTIDLKDPNILSSLTLNVQTKNTNFLEDSRSLAIIYRIAYKVMNTTVNPKL